MSLATALKDAVADARPLQNLDFRRLWVTQISTMIGAQLTAAPAYDWCSLRTVVACVHRQQSTKRC